MKKHIFSFTALIVFAVWCMNCKHDADLGIKKEGVSLKVTFNKNNNDADSTELDPAAITVQTGMAAVGYLPKEPTRQHYTFAGWNTQSNGSGESFTESTPVSANITVFAQWSGNTYTVTFDKNNTDAVSTEAVPV